MLTEIYRYKYKKEYKNYRITSSSYDTKTDGDPI